MKILARILLTITLVGSLSACEVLEPSSMVTLTQADKPVITEKQPSHSLGSTVVCCFCGMLDN